MNDTGTCQVCGRQIKLKNGRIARHGFNGMPNGLHTTACCGSKFEPYEESNRCLPIQIKGFERDIETWQGFLDTRDLRPETIRHFNKQIEEAQKFIPVLQKRFDDWKQA